MAFHVLWGDNGYTYARAQDIHGNYGSGWAVWALAIWY